MSKSCRARCLSFRYRAVVRDTCLRGAIPRNGTGRRALQLMAILCMPIFARVQAADDIQQLRKEVQELKQGQAAIQNDLQEIKKLLRQKESRTPISDINLTLTVRDDDQVKGDKKAKLTLFEYAD